MSVRTLSSAIVETILTIWIMVIGIPLVAASALWWVIPLALTDNPWWCFGVVWTIFWIGIVAGLLIWWEES